MKKSKSSIAHILRVSLVLFIAALTHNAFAAPGDVDLSFDPGSGVDATVNAVAVQPDGKVIIGGAVTMVKGLVRYRIARLHADGSGDSSFDAGQQNDGVIALAVQSDGKVLVGTIHGIRRLNSEGSMDTSFSGPQFPNEESYSIEAILVLPDGKILIGGGFYVTVGSNSYNSVARLNSDGTFDSTFKTSLGGVHALALQPDGKVLAGGDFGLVRLNTNGSVDNTFPRRDGHIRSIALQPDGKVLVGGDFRTLSTWDPSGVVRLNTDGTPDATFTRAITNTPAGSVLCVVLQSSGKILAGGYFTVNGADRRLARLNSNGTFDATFTSDVFSTDSSKPLRTIVLQPDGKPLIGGDFTAVNGVARHRIARINSDGSLDHIFNSGSGVNGSVSRMLLQPDGKTLIGGSFEAVKNVSSPTVARLNTDGSGDASFTVNSVVGDVYSMALQSDGKVLVAGRFPSSPPFYGLVRLHADGSRDNSFHPPIGSPNGPEDYVVATAVAVQPNGKVLVSGFTEDYQCDDQGCLLFASYFFSRLNADGSPDTNFNTTAEGLAWVRVIALQPDGKVLIGGQLNDGTKEVGILRLNANGSRDNSFNAGAVHIAHSMALQPDGKILFGGSFRSGNGTPRLARLNSDGGLDTGFGPGIATLPSMGVRSIALQPDGKVLAAGTSYQGVVTNRDEVARFNSDGSLDNTFNVATVTDGAIASIALQSDGNVVVGGWFRYINGVFRPHLARLQGGSVPPPVSFAGWSAGFGLSGAAAAANADPDGDGMPNGVEYILGGHPGVAAASPPGPSVSVTNGNLSFIFPRDDASESSDVTLTVESGIDLATWPAVFTIGPNTAASSPGVSIDENGAAPDLITVTIPQGTVPRRFARLNVTIGP